jgi:argininosuccinate lyase
MASFDLRANLRTVADKASERHARQAREAWGPSGLWRSLVLVNAAHVQDLSRSGVIDEAGFRAIARALDATLQAAPDQGSAASGLVRAVEDRVNAMLPPEFSGAATLGASRVETMATALRIVWRDAGLELEGTLIELREAQLHLAEAHAVTIMAAVWGGRPAAPTTLAHFLGGAVGPLALASQRLHQALGMVNRSPFGAGILAGDVLEADREQIASDLGFDGTIGNTLDALGSVEDLVALVEAMVAALAPSRRLMNEFLTWIRTDSSSFFLDASWEEHPEPSMPALTNSARLERLVLDLQRAESAARTFVDLARSLPYGPLGASWDAVADMLDEVLSRSKAALEGATAAINEAIIVNRAYLANRAGRDYTTASDLVPFLMTEESLPPTAARQIASLVVSRLREANLEASAVTQDMIDSAALMVIGRELKVEMETLGRYLAPRRFIERRIVGGSPAPEMTREWLQSERERVNADRAWSDERRQQWSSATEALAATLAAAAAEIED